MKKIFLPIILLFVSILCLACGNNTDSNMSQIEGTTDKTSSKIDIIIDENVSSNANDSNISQSEIEQIASEWENTEFEIEVNSMSSNNSSILSSDKSSVSSNTSSEYVVSKVSSSNGVSSNKNENASSNTMTSSKVTSLPDYYEGRY